MAQANCLTWLCKVEICKLEPNRTTKPCLNCKKKKKKNERMLNGQQKKN